MVAVIQEAWIGGVSTRRVDEIAQTRGFLEPPAHMTCCGFVTKHGDGYIWGDGEQYLNGRPMTHPIDKVAI